MLLHPSLANKEFNYDDILLQLNRLPDFSENEVDLSSQFTRNIRLKTPLSSAAMDTVTEADLAILMAMMGGIGVIHYNFPTINEQIAEVEKVKRFEAAFVRNPVVLSPRHTVKDIYEVHKKYGFYSCPITEDGTLETKLVGIVTHRDVRYIENMRTSLEEIMTKDVITVHRKNTLDTYNVKAVNKVIREHNLDTLVVVDDCYRVAAVVTDSDLRKDAAYPLATKDNNKQLLVFIATEGRLEKAKKRIYAAFEAEADGVVIDQSVAFREQVEIARFVKENCHGTEVVVGNVDSASPGKGSC